MEEEEGGRTVGRGGKKAKHSRRREGGVIQGKKKDRAV